MPQDFYSVPSQDELASQSRSPLPGNEQYIAEVIEVEEVTRPNYDGELQDFLKVKFNALSFKDGTELEDINGDPVDERWLWRDIDFARVGFKTDGTASLARQFFLSVMGIEDFTQKVPRVTREDMVGKRVVLSLIVYQKKDGALANRITAISPLVQRGRRRSQQAVAQEEPAEVSEEYKAALDSLVNLTPEEQEASDS